MLDRIRLLLGEAELEARVARCADFRATGDADIDNVAVYQACGRVGHNFDLIYRNPVDTLIVL